MHWACIAWSAAFFGRAPKDVEKVERWFEEYDKVLKEYDEELAPLYKVAKKFTLPIADMCSQLHRTHRRIERSIFCVVG